MLFSKKAAQSHVQFSNSGSARRPSLLPETPEVHITVMPSQKIHKPLVVAFRNPEQRQHLLITAARPLQSLMDKVLHLGPRNHLLGIGPGHGVPEVPEDHLLRRPSIVRLSRQRDVIRLDDIAGSKAHRSFHDVLQLADISRKPVPPELL